MQPLTGQVRGPLHGWRRRVLPPGPIGLLRRPFIAIAGLRRHREYKPCGRAKKGRATAAWERAARRELAGRLIAVLPTKRFPGRGAGFNFSRHARNALRGLAAASAHSIRTDARPARSVR